MLRYLVDLMCTYELFMFQTKYIKNGKMQTQKHFPLWSIQHFSTPVMSGLTDFRSIIYSSKWNLEKHSRRKYAFCSVLF